MNVGGGGEDISQIIVIRNAIIEANKEASVKGIVRSHALHCSGASTSFPKVNKKAHAFIVCLLHGFVTHCKGSFRTSGENI